MHTLHLKLLRDLIRLRGQVGAIAVVIAAGVMTLITTITVNDALTLTVERYYRDQQFAQIFVSLKRAPDSLDARLRRVDGVSLAETRVVAPVRLTIENFDDPVRGLLLSIPDGRQPDINRLHLRQGTLPPADRGDHVVVSEPFAEAHALTPGDHITAIINGRLERLTISGVALSPEFVYQISPTDILPDYQRYGVLWMNRTALAHAYGMAGAFNSAVFTLRATANESDVIARIDALIERYGGTGAHGRMDLASHRFLIEELRQQRVTSIVLPSIFLGVSAFLLNVLMARIIHTQRQEIAILKAFGYRNRDVALHYGLLTGVIVLLGCALGIGLGIWGAGALASLYQEYFRFPDISFRLQPRVVLLAIAVALTAAALGTWRAVAAAVSLAPADAMRPPAPAVYRKGWLDSSWLGHLLSQPSRIVLRNLSRYRLKAALSLVGIALSVALMLVGSYQFSAVDYLIDVQYRLVQKADLQVSFTDAVPARAAGELRHLSGVNYVDTYRTVPVRLINGRRVERTAILGMDSEPVLRGLIDAKHRAIRLPAEGLVLTDYLAEQMGAVPGQRIDVEILEGKRRRLSVELVRTVSEPVGFSAYMERQALNGLLREGPAISGAWLLTDDSRHQALFAALERRPRIAGVGLIRQSESAIRAYIESTMLVMMGILLVLSGCIAFAVVYNNARIAFSERVRELATLRVLGFTRGEVAWILIGEIMLLTLLAIPVGWLIGSGLAWLLNQAMSMDLMRLPFIITPRTYAFAAAGVLLASFVSMLLIVTRLRRLDMVSVLKTVE